jgi:hypothetical protein
MEAPHLKQNMLDPRSLVECEFAGETYFICGQKAIPPDRRRIFFASNAPARQLNGTP